MSVIMLLPTTVVKSHRPQRHVMTVLLKYNYIIYFSELYVLADSGVSSHVLVAMINILSSQSSLIRVCGDGIGDRGDGGRERKKKEQNSLATLPAFKC